jgi:hypothetical protein
MSDFTVTIRITKARKTHRCHWCGEPILKGNAYTRIFGSWGGDVGTSKWHDECDEAFKSLTWQQRDQWDLDESFDPGMFKRGTTEPNP